jgi:phospholipid/cholesterol/gamma-HCH transport system substrate-binding protein
METPTQSNWKLGVFVALGLAILVFFVFYIGKNKNIFSSTITVTGLFEDVSGLASGNNVRLAGIKIGTVTDIEFVNDSMVRVYTIVEKKSQKYIKKDSKMSISSDGLMGDKIITIIKGSPDSSSVKDGDVLATIQPFDTGKLLVSLQRTAANAEVISSEFAKISKQMNSSKGTIGRLLNDTAFADHMSRTVTHLEHASDGLSQNMEAAKHSFLLKGYYKKKKKEKETRQEEEEEKRKGKHADKKNSHEEKDSTDK